MQPFEKLITNVKGPRTEYDLAPCTVIVGPNRAGKSTILDTIRLALTGKHPVGPHPVNLAHLAPPDAKQLFAELHARDGSLAWRMDFDTSGKARKSKGVAAQGAWSTVSSELRGQSLVLDCGDLAGFGTERMRRAVMERFGDLDELPSPGALNQKQLDVWQAAVDACPNGTPSERLARMQQWFKSTAKAKGDDAKLKASTIETLRGYTAEVGGADVLAQLESQLELAREHERAVDDIARRDTLRSQLDDINTAIALLEQVDVTQVRETLQQLAQRKTEVNARLTKARALADLFARADSGCPCCGNTGVDVHEMRTALATAVADTQAELQRLSNEEQQQLGQLPDKQLAELHRQREECQRNLERVEQVLPPDYSGPSAEHLQKQVDMIRTAHDNKRRLDEESEAMHRLLDEQATAKLLQQHVTTLLGQHLQRVQVAAENAVNAYMPEPFATALNIDDSSCEWLMVGADGRPHPSGAYSGSEGGSLAIARALAWGEGAPFKLVLLDDVDLGVFDAERLAEVFAKFKKAVESKQLDQVIMAWNRPEEAPADWHIINVGVPVV